MEWTIIKRDGKSEAFDRNKITNAIIKCFKETNCDYNPGLITDKVIKTIIEIGKQPSVECVQDLVERALIEANLFQEAKNYILYRNKRTEIRESKSELYEVVASVLDNCNKDNANISNSPSAKMLQIGEAASERYYFNKMISKRFVDAHRSKRIHIHDLTFYGKTVNCLNIPLGKLLKEGFDNGHGFIRSPKRFSSAEALSAIILQSNQNSMFGGQAFSKFDEDMAPYVEIEYDRQVKRVKEELEEAGISYDNATGLEKTKIKEKIDSIAWKATEKEVAQAMQSLIFNLNSMHSRAGSQTPFSSIAVGLDTTRGGRLVTKCLLKAYQEGLGKGEQPIFPNIGFQVKKGVNRYPGDLNYDLYKLAIETTSKRLFPAYINEDASYNIDAYNKGVKVSYMGCVASESIIRYKVNGSCYVERFDHAFKRISHLFPIKTFGCSEYCETDGKVEIYDSSHKGYVNCKKFIKNNHKLHKWYVQCYELKFSDNRILRCTEDHPLCFVGCEKTTASEIYNIVHNTDNNMPLQIPVSNQTSCYQISDETCVLESIEKIEPLDVSYDVETETHFFDVNGIVSHNCRTRVVSDVNGEDLCDFRGNLFFTTINLPVLGIEAMREGKDSSERIVIFIKKLDDMLELVRDELLERYKHVCELKVKDLPFLMDQHLYIGSEELGPMDSVEPAFKHGSLTFGFIGVAEALTAIYGEHHGQSNDAQELGLSIVKRIRDYADKCANEYHLNFTVIASPAESTCMKMLEHDRKEYGVIPGITDKDWYTNSFHVPVNYDIDFASKIKLEGPYHKYCNGGHISYVELDACPSNNPSALEDMLNLMFESDMGYVSINFPTDYCNDCGLQGVVIPEDKCPRCGSEKITRIRRITGYLSKVENFNHGKLEELKHRVAHGHIND